MKAYYGQDQSTGKWYALTEIPRVTQWGDTPEEAQKNLVAYLEKHHGYTVENWRPFPVPMKAD
jgi:predicted RNase H-like HicB family nuclease